MDTSGLLIFALRRKAERELHRQFRERLVCKVYVALVDGLVSTASGTVRSPLRRVGGGPPFSVVDHHSGKPARTDFQVLGHYDGRTLLALRPFTGRSHQLRVHMLSLGHPIVGDRIYNPDFKTHNRLMLHATQIEFFTSLYTRTHLLVMLTARVRLSANDPRPWRSRCYLTGLSSTMPFPFEASFKRWDAKKTDCYRVFHGATEGVPGLSIDRYGTQLLIQTWRPELIDEADIDHITKTVSQWCGCDLAGVWNARHRRGQVEFGNQAQLDDQSTGFEAGLKYDVRLRHEGIDPLLFLDFRAARKWVASTAAGKRVLNLFPIPVASGSLHFRAAQSRFSMSILPSAHCLLVFRMPSLISSI